MGKHIRDNTEAAANAADEAWSERGLEVEEPDIDTYVEIFAGSGCNYCTKTKQLCEERNLPYRYMNMDEDEQAFDQLVGRIKKWNTVPQIFIGPKHIGGYDDLVRYLGAI